VEVQVLSSAFSSSSLSGIRLVERIMAVAEVRKARRVLSSVLSSELVSRDNESAVPDTSE
jgi:hypothetical protein